MSYLIDYYRRHWRERTQRDAGLYPGDPVTMRAEMATLGHETELWLEPHDLTDTDEDQGEGGGFGFMADLSEVDGPDPVL